MWRDPDFAKSGDAPVWTISGRQSPVQVLLEREYLEDCERDRLDRGFDGSWVHA
jgi:hypothetical protein